MTSIDAMLAAADDLAAAYARVRAVLEPSPVKVLGRIVSGEGELMIEAGEFWKLALCRWRDGDGDPVANDYGTPGVSGVWAALDAGVPRSVHAGTDVYPLGEHGELYRVSLHQAIKREWPES